MTTMPSTNQRTNECSLHKLTHTHTCTLIHIYYKNVCVCVWESWAPYSRVSEYTTKAIIITKIRKGTLFCKLFITFEYYLSMVRSTDASTDHVLIFVLSLCSTFSLLTWNERAHGSPSPTHVFSWFLLISHSLFTFQCAHFPFQACSSELVVRFVVSSVEFFSLQYFILHYFISHYSFIFQAIR